MNGAGDGSQEIHNTGEANSVRERINGTEMNKQPFSPRTTTSSKWLLKKTVSKLEKMSSNSMISQSVRKPVDIKSYLSNMRKTRTAKPAIFNDFSSREPIQYPHLLSYNDLEISANSPSRELEEWNPSTPKPSQSSHANSLSQLPTPRGSPDKALPPLPCATIVPNSPLVRRSLIDATNKPLLRTASSEAGMNQEEEWPTLSPTPSPPTDCCSNLQQGHDIKPSLSQSLIDGMQSITIDDDKENDMNETSEGTQTNEAAQTETTTFREELLRHSHVKPSFLSRQRLSSPLTNLTQPSGPHIRHTKTSELRLRLSANKIESAKSEKDQTDSKTSQATPLRAPVRRHSKIRHAATTRGSPYTIPVRAKFGIDKVTRDSTNNCLHSKDTKEPRTTAQNFREINSITEEFKNLHQKSSISKDRHRPLPGRDHVLSLTGENSNHELEVSPQIDNFYNLQHESEDADIDTDPELTPLRCEVFVEHVSNSHDSCRSETTTPNREEPYHAHTKQEQVSVAEDGGVLQSTTHLAENSTGAEFRFKKVANCGESPVLRIAKSADRLILGSEAVPEESQYGCEYHPRHRSPSLRHSVVLKEHLRRSRDLIQSPLQIKHSLTPKPSSRFKQVTRNPEEGEQHVIQDEMTDLPGPSRESQPTTTKGNELEADQENREFNAQGSKLGIMRDKWLLQELDGEMPFCRIRDNMSSPVDNVHPDFPAFPPRKSSRFSPCSPTDLVCQAFVAPQESMIENVNEYQHRVNHSPIQTCRESLPVHDPQLDGKKCSIKQQVLVNEVNDVQSSTKKSKLKMRGFLSTYLKSSNKTSSSQARTSGQCQINSAKKSVLTNSSPISPSTPVPSKHRNKAQTATFNTSLSRDFVSPSKIQPPQVPTSTSTFITSAVESIEIQEATRIALELLDKARDESKFAVKARLVDLSKLMVRIVTSARDAEQAMEKANQAAAQAGIHSLETRKQIKEVSRLVARFLEHDN